MPKVTSGKSDEAPLCAVTGRVVPPTGDIHWWAKEGGFYGGIIYSRAVHVVKPSATGDFILRLPPSKDAEDRKVVGPIIVQFGRESKIEIDVPHDLATVEINELRNLGRIKWLR